MATFTHVGFQISLNRGIVLIALKLIPGSNSYSCATKQELGAIQFLPNRLAGIVARYACRLTARDPSRVDAVWPHEGR